MLTRESSAQVTPASVRLLNVNGVPYFWPLRLSRCAGGASVGGEARKAVALWPAANCCGCGAGAGAPAVWRSAAAIRGAALTIAPTRISISPWFRTMGGGYRRMWRGAQLAHTRRERLVSDVDGAARRGAWGRRADFGARPVPSVPGQPVPYRAKVASRVLLGRGAFVAPPAWRARSRRAGPVRQSP